MGIFDFLKRETKESQAASVMVVNPGQPTWTPREYDKLAQEGYVQNVVGYQCVNRIAEAVSSVRWTTFRGDTESTENPLLTLLQRPNPQQSLSEYLTAKVSFYLLAGNSYEERVTLNGQPRELYVLRPDRMTVTMDASGAVSRYTYKVGMNQTHWDGDSGDIWHMKTFHPVHDTYGLAPIEPGAWAIDQHNESMSWMQALLQNSARPSGALVSGDVLSNDNFARLKAQIEEQFSGSRNAGRPMILENGLDWKQMGMSPNDMQIIEGKFSAARDVALSFGVPPQLLGIPGDNTYANYAEARLAFWEDTVIPLVNRIAEDWTIWLGAEFGDLVVKPDLDQIPAIADKRQTLWAMAEASTVLTIDEKREMMGLEPVAGGDVLLVDAGKLPLSDAGLSFDDPDMKALAAIAGYETK